MKIITIINLYYKYEVFYFFLRNATYTFSLFTIVVKDKNLNNNKNIQLYIDIYEKQINKK